MKPGDFERSLSHLSGVAARLSQRLGVLETATVSAWSSVARLKGDESSSLAEGAETNNMKVAERTPGQRGAQVEVQFK